MAGAGGRGRRRPRRASAAAVLAVALVAAGASADVRAPVADPARSAQQDRVACAVTPSLVDVLTESAFRPGGGTRASGVVIGTAGEVLTNNHVVASAGDVRVRVVASGRTYPAEVLGTDIPDDLAVLRIVGAPRLHPAVTGGPAAVRVGQRVYALGNAEGRCTAPSVSTGTVTALDRAASVTDDLNGDPVRLEGLVETDLRLRPGYSGGAVADAAGRVVGIVVAGRVATGRDTAASAYAIPIDRAMAVAAAVLAGTGSARVHVGPTASLGTETAPATTVAFAGFVTGALVVRVLPGSAGARAGLAAGDQIVAVDDTAVHSGRELTEVLQQLRPGDRIGLAWLDAWGRPRRAEVRLQAGPPQ